MALIPVHMYQRVKMSDPQPIDHVYKNIPCGLDQPRSYKTKERRSSILRAVQPNLEQEQMLLMTEQSHQDRKTTRNRIAQRKHRERKCALLRPACGAEGFCRAQLRAGASSRGKSTTRRTCGPPKSSAWTSCVFSESSKPTVRAGRLSLALKVLRTAALTVMAV